VGGIQVPGTNRPVKGFFDFYMEKGFMKIFYIFFCDPISKKKTKQNLAFLSDFWASFGIIR